MYRNERILTQKGMNKVASVFDALSISNRLEEKTFPELDKQSSDWLDESIEKFAHGIHSEFMDKQAAFSNGLQLFGDVRKMISDSLGVSEGVAHDLTSSVITRSDKIQQEYGGDQINIISNIVNEMKGQAIDNPESLGGSVDLHPMTYNSREVQEQVKSRLIQEMGMTSRESEVYKDLIMKQAQDLTSMLRPHKRDAIALAVVDVLIETRDRTSLYDLKNTPMLMQAIKTQLGV
jgi:hypothetical protein